MAQDTWRNDAFEQLPDAVMVLDTDCVVREVNRKACEVLNRDRDDIIGKPCSESCVCGRGEQHCFIRRVIEREEPVEEQDTRLISGGGQAATMLVTAVPVRDGKGEVVGGMEIMRDVSLIDVVNRELKELAEKDELTGLSRRHVLFGSLERESARNRRHGNPFSVLMIDVDDFKGYNDRFGHQAGDEVLRTVGRILREEIRQEDTAGRYGGEEFVSVLVESGSDRARGVAERMLARVRAITGANSPDGEPVTISVGVASCEGGADGCDSYTMLRRADDALYEAKWAGKDRIRVAGADREGHRDKEGDT